MTNKWFMVSTAGKKSYTVSQPLKQDYKMWCTSRVQSATVTIIAYNSDITHIKYSYSITWIDRI